MSLVDEYVYLTCSANSKLFIKQAIVHQTSNCSGKIKILSQTV